MSLEMAESSNPTSKRHGLGASTKSPGTCQCLRIHRCSHWQAPLSRKALMAIALFSPVSLPTFGCSPLRGKAHFAADKYELGFFFRRPGLGRLPASHHHL